MDYLDLYDMIEYDDEELNLDSEAFEYLKALLCRSSPRVLRAHPEEDYEIF